MTVRTKRRKRIILESDEEEEEDQYTKDEQHVIEIDSDVEEEKGEEKGEEKDTASVFDFPTSSPPRPVLKRYPKRKRISRFAQLTEGKEEQDLLNHPAVINELFQSDDLLIYPYSGKNAVSLRKRDLQRLEEDELLNDALMDIYPKILEETHPEANIHTFSSLFYTRLISKSRTKRGGRITIDHDSVKRWTNNYNLFSKSCLIIPIEQRNHWYLAVVIHPGYCIQKLDQSEEKSIVLDDEEKSIVLDDEEKSIVLDDENEEKNENKSENRSSENDDLYDDERPYIAILDPLGKKHAATYRSICEYLKEEAMDKLNITEERFVLPDLLQGDCPHQTNFSDCGVFCLHFVKQIYENPELMMYALVNQNVETVTDEHWNKEDIPELRKVLQLMLLEKFDGYEAYTRNKQEK